MGAGMEVRERRRRYWTIQEKRQIVEPTFVVGFVSCVSGAGAWRKREPGLLLEEALPRWTEERRR